MREKIVCLVSGGIDSPVACALLARRFEVLPLHFCAYPYAPKDAFKLTIEALGKLRKITGFGKAVIFPWAGVLGSIVERIGRREFTCLVCKRAMFKAAELVCRREGAIGIATGESLGQKASQTLSNLVATSSGIRFPILRPLLGLDKLEIERLSKRLGLWRERHAGGCKALPKRPRTRVDARDLDEFVIKLKIDRLVRENYRRAKELRTFKTSARSLLSEFL